jgi:hypothetical protein
MGKCGNEELGDLPKMGSRKIGGENSGEIKIK